MPHNRKYPSGAEKRRKKEEDKADEKCKSLLDRVVVVEQGFPNWGTCTPRAGVGKHFLRRATLKILLLPRAACGPRAVVCPPLP